MDIKAGVETAVLLAVVGGFLLAWAGYQSIRSGSRLTFFRLRQQRVTGGWLQIFFGVGLLGLAYFLGMYGEPVAYQYFPPSPSPSLSPTITQIPTITLTPTISLTPTITETPSITDTPTITPTPFMPLAIEALFESNVTPNPNAIFSPLTFALDIDSNFQPVRPATTFSNPLRRIYVLYSYDQMIPGVQWTALWYLDGELVYYETAPWDGTTGGYGSTFWAPEGGQWLPGMYQVQIFVGMEWKAVGEFEVQGDPPTPTPSITPTPAVSPTPSLTATMPFTPTASPTATRPFTPTPGGTTTP